MLHIVKKGLTFDDVLLSPSRSNILPKNVDVSTKLTKKIKLKIPILSAAMDTVTESSMAIALAQEGGMGFIHKNMSIKNQIKEIKKVKRYENGMIMNPKCVTPNTSISTIKNITIINGFGSYPVVTENGKLIGIVTRRDALCAKDINQSVCTVMTPKDKLVTVYQGEKQEIVLSKMYDKRVEKALVVDRFFNLIGMITVKDFKKSEKKPYACKDKYGRLRVGAAISLEKNYIERINLLINSGIDVLLIDSSHGHSENILKKIRSIRDAYPDVQIIGGNVATGEGALDLIKSGVDAVKVGIGPGSICTTRIVTGVGVPQLTAISDAVDAIGSKDIPVIADGGIRFSGDIAKAIAAGAKCVMLGSLLAGSKESPGDIELYHGRSFKIYRGMGSVGAMFHGSSERYFQKNNKIDKLVPEGVEGRVPYKGCVKNIIYQQIGGLRSCMGLTGSSNIEDLRTKTTFVQITRAGIQESHVHDVSITKESPNYNLK
ncbi:guaB [Wigglesworthia glossinidia endosymbiont of Glossina brevipalpis]|uniref:Inosine-5'-monophosphate dehydrogenase n=1 Tax=Wigglesworthia glossinidia brevipalpis TaxID=36870 RepID=Q8D1V1_WIGBR|nr:guaB [Wigglesworthia glossinidia endosymbiont of Glossina brevipalpis]